MHALFPGPLNTRSVGILLDGDLDFVLRETRANKQKDKILGRGWGWGWVFFSADDFHGGERLSFSFLVPSHLGHFTEKQCPPSVLVAK